MDEEPSDEPIFPINTNTFAIPQEHNLLLAYDVYKPSLQIEHIKSEQGRTIFAEAFIEDLKLGTLSDLCVRTLAKAYGPEEVLGLVSSDPLKLRIHYDSLDTELPLEKCYMVDDELFWRRFVLSKTTDNELMFKKSHNWREIGVAMKYVELVEQCPAEYWPEDDMKKLALKVKPYVTEMHIKTLKPLEDSSFNKYIDSDSEESEEEDEDDEIIDWEATGDGIDTDYLEEHVEREQSVQSIEEAAEEANEEQEEDETNEQLFAKQSKLISRAICLPIYMTTKDLEMRWEVTEMDAMAKSLREEEEAEIERVKELRSKQKAYRNKINPPKPPPPPPPPKKKKKRRGDDEESINFESVLDVPVEDSEEDLNANEPDRRNLAELLYRQKKYLYPAKDCHHINLNFVRYFDLMRIFTIEFGCADQDRNYESRHFNFSYDDVTNLAQGIKELKNLQVFRLRCSRMDRRKLEIIVDALQQLENIETIDFGSDQLQDDCGWALKHIFEGSTSIKELELECNDLGNNAIMRMALSLRRYEGKLEYLGLSRNRIDIDGLCRLAEVLIEKNQVVHLDLSGLVISQEGLISCLANQIILNHTELKHINLTGVMMQKEAAVEIVKALDTNKIIQYLDTRGCGMDFDIEADIDVLLKRNRYIAENPYIGDETKTEEEIMEYVNRIKHPILLSALAAVEKEKMCWARQTPDIWRVPSFSVETISDIILPHLRDMAAEDSTHDILDALTYVKTPTAPFEYDPNNFTEEEFHEKVYLAGPNERYYYFRAKNRSAFR